MRSYKMKWELDEIKTKRIKCECENCYKIINLISKIDIDMIDDVGIYCRKCQSIIYSKIEDKR